VLDVATGGGRTALAFASIVRRVVAYDLTEPMLSARAHVRARGAAMEFVAGDAAALPFRDESFDVVTCRTAAHHFSDVAAAVRQIHRVLRPGGSLLLQDILGHDDAEASAFLLEVEKRRDPSHVRSYRAAEWKAFLRAVGLTVIEDSVIWKLREWNEWTGRMRMTAEARRDLENFVRRAPERCRAAFDFRLTPDAVVSFNDRQVLIRADRD
jgi:ubiquinone/menaquinone biosynthesis C-methylase UbiE